MICCVTLYSDLPMPTEPKSVITLSPSVWWWLWILAKPAMFESRYSDHILLSNLNLRKCTKNGYAYNVFCVHGVGVKQPETHSTNDGFKTCTGVKYLVTLGDLIITSLRSKMNHLMSQTTANNQLMVFMLQQDTTHDSRRAGNMMCMRLLLYISGM